MSVFRLKTRLWIAAGMLALAALACNTPGGDATPLVPTAPPISLPTQTPAAATEAVVSPTSTPVVIGPTPTQQAGQAQRISFAPGGISATVQGSVTPGQRLTYLISAAKNQTMTVQLTGSGRVGLGVVGLGVAQDSADGKTSWSGLLTATGDYALYVQAFDGPATFTLVVTIPPAPTAASTVAHPCVVPTLPASAADGASWALYCSPAYGFGFRYPPSQLTHSEQMDLIALPFVKGTNLVEKNLAIEVKEGVSDCSAATVDPYQPNVEASGTASFNGVSFKKESGTGVGAGQDYQWVTYSTAHGSTCLGLTFVLHSGNPGNYPTPPPLFDPTAESAVFDQIMATFGWPGA